MSARPVSRLAHVEGLLNTLEAERHMRGPLLLTLVDVLVASEYRAQAAAASTLFARMRDGELTEDEFASSVQRLRLLVSPR